MYIPQAVVLLVSTLIYGLMVMETHDLACDWKHKRYTTSVQLRSDLMLAFFVNLVSLLVNSVIVPYFDLS